MGPWTRTEATPATWRTLSTSLRALILPGSAAGAVLPPDEPHALRVLLVIVAVLTALDLAGAGVERLLHRAATVLGAVHDLRAAWVVREGHNDGESGPP